MRNAIPYRGMLAMPGSRLHELLEAGKTKDAEAHAKDIERRHAALMADTRDCK